MLQHLGYELLFYLCFISVFQSSNLIHDAQVARQLQLEMKGERYREDEELARRLAAEFNLDHTTQHSTDEELALQLIREELVNTV